MNNLNQYIYESIINEKKHSSSYGNTNSLWGKIKSWFKGLFDNSEDKASMWNTDVEYENEDGSIDIPEALRPYMGGTEKLIPNK